MFKRKLKVSQWKEFLEMSILSLKFSKKVFVRFQIKRGQNQIIKGLTNQELKAKLKILMFNQHYKEWETIIMTLDNSLKSILRIRLMKSLLLCFSQTKIEMNKILKLIRIDYIRVGHPCLFYQRLNNKIRMHILIIKTLSLMRVEYL